MQFKKTILFLSSAALPRDYRLNGVFELGAVSRSILIKNITFPSHQMPTTKDIERRCNVIVSLAKKVEPEKALIELPSFMISRVESGLRMIGITPVHAMSEIQRYAEDCDSYESGKFGETVIKTRFVLKGFVFN